MPVFKLDYQHLYKRFSVLCHPLISLLEPFYARKSILCRIYTEYIHHFLSRLKILKVHCRNIARKLHDIFVYVSGRERMCVFHAYK